MDSFRNVFIGLSLGYVLIWAYLILPSSDTLYSFFPFHTQLLSKQAYIDYLAWRALLALIFVMFWYLADKHNSPYRHEYFITMLLWIGFMIDYMLIYNDPGLYFTWTGFTNRYPSGELFIPIGYPLIMGMVIFVLVIKALKK